jgi:large subunit ribosomal protein L24
MKIKSGDNVKILSGKSRGQTGAVIQVLTNKASGESYVVVEGANMRKKHMRSRKAGEKGQVLELAAPMHISKVMLIDPSTKQATRVGYTREGNVKKRIAKKSGQLI